MGSVFITIFFAAWLSKEPFKCDMLDSGGMNVNTECQ